MFRFLAGIVLLGVSSAAPVPTLVISGQNNHDWRTTTPHLRKLLAATGKFDVRVTEEPAGLTEKGLAKYQVIVLDYNGPRWGPEAERAVAAFVRSGKGLVVVHGASYAFGDMEILADKHVRTGVREPVWAEYREMVGGWWSGAEPKSGHAPRHIYEVKFTDRAHPIASGLGPGFLVTDELYHNLRVKPGIHVIAAANDDKSIGGTGRDEPLLWTVDYGQGRVFHTALGHDVAAMMDPGFIATFVRGTEWAATGAVTIPAKLEPEAPRGSPRVLVVTGGHDHETTFYSMFEQFAADMLVNVNPHPIPYNRDLRKDYDVLVLYDTIQNLTEPQRANLRAFVETPGKGLVALHHSIADFVDWPWWYEEVIGGRYLLKADAGLPASTYKHDEELRAIPASKHPILRGIPPMHLWDETYKKMWISPKVEVLLKTDNPTSDGPIAWVSPYNKARVVFVQLGHGRTAHLYPPYQQLVRNAILWSAGRLE